MDAHGQVVDFFAFIAGRGNDDRDKRSREPHVHEHHVVERFGRIVPERADRLVDQAARTHAGADDVGSADDGAADRIGDAVVVGRNLDQDRANEMAAHAGGTEHVPGTGCGNPEGHLAVPFVGRVAGTAGAEVVVRDVPLHGRAQGSVVEVAVHRNAGGRIEIEADVDDRDLGNVVGPRHLEDAVVAEIVPGVGHAGRQALVARRGRVAVLHKPGELLGIDERGGGRVLWMLEAGIEGGQRIDGDAAAALARDHRQGARGVLGRKAVDAPLPGLGQAVGQAIQRGCAGIDPQQVPATRGRRLARRDVGREERHAVAQDGRVVAGDEVLQLLLVRGVQHDLVADELQRGTFGPDHRRHRARRPVIQPRDLRPGARDRGVNADLSLLAVNQQFASCQRQRQGQQDAERNLDRNLWHAWVSWHRIGFDLVEFVRRNARICRRRARANLRSSLSTA